MSRCYPFPPPGYVLNGIRGEAVIESTIKGAEEKAKKEQRRKEKKREKKEKREKKRKERKEREGKEGESEKRRHKRRRKEEEGCKDDQNRKVEVLHKLKENKTECLEKSSLTIERELLQSTSQNSCDSTLNSNELPKQKEKLQPLDGRHNNDSESIIRIRLPIRMQRDPEEVMMTNKNQQNPPPSMGIKIDSSQRVTREQPVDQHTCSTSFAPEHASKPCEVERKDTKLGKEKVSLSTSEETIVQPPSSLCSICPPSVAVQFLNVVENWVPNTVERRLELLSNSKDEEECWWLSKKPSNKFGTERCKQLNNEIKEVSCSMAWPRARLLPEADIHALPYTVPF